ncbi:hypothetical protein BDW74DRAFT_180491 [Aspergillus multicolor]|uniref:uncharacterized protein n=1 Tax=Aspergillus multicolor TaxID=41759 RepID=UPI003CCE4B52
MAMLMMMILLLLRPTTSSLESTGLTIAWVFAGFAIIVLATRYYVRLRIIKKATIDDALIFLALALSLGNSSFLTISTHWGLGSHLDTLSETQIMYSIKWVYLCEFFSILAPCVGRVAYASLLLGIFPPIPWRSRLLWYIICIQVVVDCESVDARELLAARGAAEYGVFPELVLEKVVCYAVDFTLAVFPASMFWSLQMEWEKKVSLSCLMGLGLFKASAVIASIVKTVQLRAIAATDDLTHVMAYLAIWWTLEANLVILAASIPTLRPSVHPHAHSRSAASSGSQHVLPWWGRLSSSLWWSPKRTAEESATGSFQLLSGSSRESRRGSQPLEQGAASELKEGAIEKTTTIGIVYEDPGNAEAGAEGEGVSPWPPQPQSRGAGSRRPSR